MPALLLNVSELANELGRAPSYVTAMKAIGFEFDYGNRCTLAHALEWLRAHPTFRTTGYRFGSSEFVKQKKRPSRRQPQAADRSNEPAHSND